MATFKKSTLTLAAVCSGAVFQSHQSHAAEPKVMEPAGSIPMLSVEDSLGTFELPPGYRLEPVLTEPQISEPVVCAFDGNGRMYVAEMRTYMQDADATGEQKPLSRVSLHEDTDGDGRMDKHSVFADGLLLPRLVLPLDDRVLIQETNTLDIFSYRDTDGDGVADEKELFFKGGPRGGNMEHQPSGLIWSMDNWLYTTYSAFRIRYNPGGAPLKEPTAANGGQWGLCQDNQGKPWFVNAGGERGPINFQQPIVYGGFNMNDQFEEGYKEVHPLVGIPDVQGGPKRFRPETQTLNHFTATCGQEIFRGDRLPEELRGDLLFSEPVGRLIRRSKVTVDDGVTKLSNAHPGSEFIRSFDPNFRVVNMVTAPDGCLYLVDMYRGIIQQGNWTKKGSYLRGVINEYGLDKNIGAGRIYRLVHEDFERGPQPKMLDESPAELVAHLEHPNGWWRDTAQKLMILRGDKSIAGALEKQALGSESVFARMHALWTLEGLGVLKAETVRKAMADEDPRVRATAVRTSEWLFKHGDDSLSSDLTKLAGDPDPQVVIQTMMTAKHLKLPEWKATVTAATTANISRGVQEIGRALAGDGGAAQKPASALTKAERASYQRGMKIYQSLCFSCHGEDGYGTVLPEEKNQRLAPPLAASPIVTGHPELAVKVLLHGLSGPVDGKEYPGEMIGMASNGDQWVADVLTYVRNSFGNGSSAISKSQVSGISKSVGKREEPWTEKELFAHSPHALDGCSEWKLSASHGKDSLVHAVDGKLDTRFTTSQSMAPGMWLQVELPETENISGMMLDAAGSKGDYPRGYKVEVSTDGKQWSKPVAEGKGTGPRTEIVFGQEVPARFVRVTQTGKNRLYWSVHQMEIWGR
ncbi:glucanendo-1,6-beta-glucosidase [Haloferula helveola]|uniref:Glucanendo-1,6-beta-glucosidase n=1 Tax=Haloferula helveola TaxID=490095 RepID=A0ABM7RBU6_9BACT|nr:glucanendo-1,6-beta-glucosidase [Haloferula helveola]